MPKPNDLPPPYSEILVNLIASVMRAQAELVAGMIAGLNLQDVPDFMINRHFCWLIKTFKEGSNRHLFYGSGENKSLRVQPPIVTDPDVELRLKNKEPISFGIETAIKNINSKKIFSAISPDRIPRQNILRSCSLTATKTVATEMPPLKHILVSIKETDFFKNHQDSGYVQTGPTRIGKLIRQSFNYIQINNA